MKISVDISALRKTQWHEYAIRFLFGGLITATAGVIAAVWGPGIAGLALAFPAIFPASATLIEKHQRKSKEQAGVAGIKRGRQVAAVDAAGAAIGSLGLISFSVLSCQLLKNYPPLPVLTLATIAWAATSALIWRLWKAV
jgi:hypothetical protein